MNRNVTFARRGGGHVSMQRLESRLMLAAQPQLVKDVNLTAAVGSEPSDLINFNGTLLFVAGDGENGRKVWKSDGTVDGTVMLARSGFSARELTLVDGAAYFTASTYSPRPVFDEEQGFGYDYETDYELYRTDGSDTGTSLVRNIEAEQFGPAFNFGSDPSSLTGFNGAVFFSAWDEFTATELWKSAGTADTTSLVKDIDPTSHQEGYPPDWDTIYHSSDPSELTAVNDVLFFVTRSGSLWRTNGTETGTRRVTDAAPVPAQPRYLTNFNGSLIFTAEDPDHGREIWKSDGTADGTVLLFDVNPGSKASDPAGLVVAGSTLYFTANDGSHGRELWKSDGTPAGTTRVTDIAGGGRSSEPQSLCDVNGTLFFSADDRTTGRELWKSDGTPAGTVRVKDIFAGAAGSSPANMTSANGAVFFSANDGRSGVELWRSDGTEAGTIRIGDINLGAGDASPGNLTQVGDALFFHADDGEHGVELWKLALDDTSANGQIVNITGTAGADTIVVEIEGANLQVRLNGQVVQAAATADVAAIRIDAGDGDDVVDCSASPVAVFVDAGDGDDSVTGGNGDDVILAGAGNDSVAGGDGDDHIAGGEGADTLIGGAQRDVIDGGTGADLLSGGGGKDKLLGGGGHDRLYGGNDRDTLVGNGGNDRLDGGAAGDRLYGGGGTDTLLGWGGNDRFFARDGNVDHLIGGQGDDFGNIDDAGDLFDSSLDRVTGPTGPGGGPPEEDIPDAT